MEPYDDFGRFILGAEQLSVCRELLLSASTPKQRMAVILLDSLAEALLYRVMQEAFLYSDQAWFSDLLPLYPEKKRQRMRTHFAEKLKILREPSYAIAVAGYPAIVTETDITTMAIGHSYRNAAYHRDTHNPAVLATIGKMFFKSVSALFVSAQHPGVGLYITKGQAARLSSVGIDLSESKLGHEILEYRDAAIGLISSLKDGMDVAAEDMALELAEDLESRLEDLKESIDYLREAPGDIDEHLEWMEFWTSNCDDEELMRLKDARDKTIHDLRNMSVNQITPAMRDEEARAANAHGNRFWELWQERETRTNSTILDSLSDIQKVATRLPMRTLLAPILEEYRAADERLSTIEQQISEAVAAYEAQTS